MASRTAAATDNAIKESSNLCPICWMPLKVSGTGPYTDRWRAVQTAFKGKPAFGVTDKGDYFGRSVLVFGMYEALSGGKKSNAEECHYVHYVNLGTHRAKSPWKMGRVGDVATDVRLNTTDRMPTDTFLCELFSTAGGDPGGIFASALEPNSEFDLYTKANFIHGFDSAILYPIIDDVMLSGSFAGCADCNQCMSQPVTSKFKHIHHIFECLFPSAGRNTFSVESMTHYIMLCGALDASERCAVTAATPAHFDISGTKRPTWGFRYITMWCALQILLCKWQMAERTSERGHHTDYMFIGVMDFYLSLWFYTMHQLGFIHSASSDARSPKLDFQDFHFYYSSMYPFLNAHNGNPNAPVPFYHLYYAMFPNNPAVWKRPPDLAGIQAQMKSIYMQVMTYWKLNLSQLSGAIHTKTVGIHNNYQYLIKIDEIDRRKIAMKRIPAITIDNFVGFMGAHFYWLHFRYITMPLIAQRCDEYRNRLPRIQMGANTLWFNWCRVLDARANALGVRFYMQQRRIWMEQRRLECCCP